MRSVPPRALLALLNLDGAAIDTEEAATIEDAVKRETASDAVRETLSQLDEASAHADAADSQQHRQLLALTPDPNRNPEP